MWVVRRDGALGLAAVRSVSAPAPARAWRLLTAVGQLALPEGAYVSTGGGRFLTGSEVDDLLQRGQEVDLDVISPSDVEYPALRAGGQAKAVKHALGALHGATIQVPVSNGTADVVDAPLVALLDSAGVEYRRRVDGRWLAFTLQGLPPASTLASGAFAEQADTLLLATAWEANEGRITSRIRAGDSIVLQCLIAALVGDHRPYEVKWTPKYSPVECRIRPVEEPSIGAFVEVDAVVPATGMAFELNLASAGRPVVGLTVTTSRL
jgi:hypothetical protein